MNPPAKVIYLARHGRTVMNSVAQISAQIRYDPLDALGFKHRVGLFLLLKDQPIKAIFTSELRRARQTAALLAAHFKIKPVAWAELNEFRGGINAGICSAFLKHRPSSAAAARCDMTSDEPLVKQAEAYLRSEYKRSRKVGLPYRAPGGGESILDVDKRLKRFLKRFPRRLENATVLLVGHSGANRFLLANLMGWKPVDALRVRQGHTVVWRIERRGKGRTPVLKVYRDGRWHPCPDAPTLKRGISCLPRKRRKRPKPPTVTPPRPNGDVEAPRPRLSRPRRRIR